MPKRSAVRARKQDQKHGAAGLLAALRFVSSAQKPNGAIEAHCQIANGCIAAFDGNITIGALIDEEFTAMPHTHSFISALSKCGESISITVDEKIITIGSDKSRFTVQCAPEGSLPPLYPDANIAPVDDRIKEAFRVAGIFAKEGALKVIEASLLLEANIATGTNGYAAIQYRHGIDLPPNLAISKRFSDLVCKHPQAVTGFGFCEGRSVTFWFADGSFIKGSLFSESWPNVDRVLSIPSNQFPIPCDFFNAVRSCSEFGDDSNIEFTQGAIASYPVKPTSARVEIDGLPTGRIFSGKMLLLLEPHMERADFSTYPDRIVFEGDNRRGVLMGKGIK